MAGREPPKEVGCLAAGAQNPGMSPRGRRSDGAPSAALRRFVLAVALAPCSLLACGDSGGETDSGTTGLSGPPQTSTGGVSLSGASAPGTGATQATSGVTGTTSGATGVDTNDGAGCIDSWTEDVLSTFSYIWIANSVEGTVSKIDTKTGVEVGRYLVSPEPDADPSRTSVNLRADVVIADRAGGLTMIAADPERCVDSNGEPGIQTSTGPDDVRAWGTDDCVVWRVALPDGGAPLTNDGKPTIQVNYAGPRPVAWESALDGLGCPNANPRVWVGWYEYALDTAHFARLDGATGAFLDEVEVPDWLNDEFPDEYGRPYGGAVNAQGDFWAIGWNFIGSNRGPLVRIDGDDLSVTRVELPDPPGGGKLYPYGMALDRYGNPWLAGEQTIYGYKPGADTWTTFEIPEGRMRGLMGDSEGNAWIALNNKPPEHNNAPGLVKADTISGEVLEAELALPDAIRPVGVSIDHEGFVWVVDQDGDRAYKVDPVSHEVALTAEGLNGPYTYSDMTGAMLGLVTLPPEE